METPSSEPDVSVSVHLIQIVEPGLTERPEIVPLIVARQAEVFPSVGPAALWHALPGETNERAATFVKLPVVRSDADVLYENVSPSGTVDGPRRHISPSNAIASAVIGPDPLLVSFAPYTMDVTEPLPRLPSARSVADAAPKL